MATLLVAAICTSLVPATLASAATTKTSTTTSTTKTVKVTSLKLSKTSLSVLKGSTSKLTVTASPSTATNKAVAWTSSKPSVAKVDSNGKITAVAAGTTYITVKSKDGSNKTATCKVTVTNPVLVKSLSLNKTSLSLLKGSASTLTTTVSPSNATNKAVTWTSSKPSVAKVDSNGKITAVAAGTTYITVKSKDGSNKTATCKVTVTNPVLVTGVSLNTSKLSLLEGGTSTLTTKIAPSNATNKAVTWTSSKPSVAKVDSNGKVTAIGEGKAVITATAKDGSKKKATCEVTVTKAAEQLIGTWTSSALNLGDITINGTLTIASTDSTHGTIKGSFSGSSVQLPYTIVKNNADYCVISVEYKGKKREITFKFSSGNRSKVNVSYDGSTFNVDETLTRK